VKPEPIDRVFSSEDEIIPSSGFLGEVMARVREEAAAPLPIPFPWKRAVPGILLLVGVLGWAASECIRYGLPAARQLHLSPPHFSAAAQSALEQTGWVALALAVPLASWLLSTRMVRRSGLF
jgi:hypothetical protein